MTHETSFGLLIEQLGLENECAATLLKMRIAFISGSGQPADVSGFRSALELANKVDVGSTEHRSKCKCADK